MSATRTTTWRETHPADDDLWEHETIDVAGVRGEITERIGQVRGLPPGLSPMRIGAPQGPRRARAGAHPGEPEQRISTPPTCVGAEDLSDGLQAARTEAPAQGRGRRGSEGCAADGHGFRQVVADGGVTTGCRAVCGGVRRKGREMVYRHSPREARCVSCAEGLSYRPSARWEHRKAAEVRRRAEKQAKRAR